MFKRIFTSSLVAAVVATGALAASVETSSAHGHRHGHHRHHHHHGDRDRGGDDGFIIIFG